MSIKSNIEGVIEKIHQEREEIGDPNKPHEFSDQVRTKAMNAIFGNQEQYVTYMQLFAENGEELARLMPADGDEEENKRNIARAYLVANGMCAPGTGDGLLNNVTGDLNLPSA
jgi:hypothetical protein